MSFICPLLEDEDSAQKKKKDIHRSQLVAICFIIIPELRERVVVGQSFFLVNNRSVLSQNIGLEISETHVFHFDRDVQ